jgi:penicillin-binding protein 1B
MFAEKGPAEYTPAVRRGWKIALWTAFFAGLALLLLDSTVRMGFGDRRWRAPVRFHAAPFRVAVGDRVLDGGFSAELEALGYRRVEDIPAEPGAFRWSEEGIELYLRSVPRPGAFGPRPARMVRLGIAEGRVRAIFDEGEGRVGFFELEPRVLEGLFDAHWTHRRPMRLADVPRPVVDAVLAAEDARFFDHAGVDPNSLMRALRINLEAWEVKQGGSTITQQLVKNHFLTQERSVWRKMREIPMALALERRYEKEEILEAYLATVYLGHDRLLGIHGLAEGAWVFFGKSVTELTLGEGATLAGIIRAPNVYSPLRHPERARTRRDEVLDHMESLGWISADEANLARAEPMGVPHVRRASPEAYFIQHAVAELEAEGFAADSLPTGSDVFTTLDAHLQGIVDGEVQSARDRLGGAQIAVVAIEPLSGAIRALTGGRDYLESQFDRVTRIRRPVGSLFKPFVALAAISDPDLAATAITRIEDAPLRLGEGESVWEPQNYDGRFRGAVTLREALSESLNVPMVRLAEEFGVERLAAFGDRLEIGARTLPRLPSIALGAFEASLLDVVAAFGVFPGAGVRAGPFAVRAVKAPSGVVLHRHRPEETRIATAAASYVVHDILEDVVVEGTAEQLRKAGVGAAIAGKTGTSSDQRDAWFVGYTPELVLGVWVGFDDDRPLPGGAAQLAVPLWGAIARRAFSGVSLQPFRPPVDVELVEIDVETGRKAGPGCGRSATEVFVAGTAPQGNCDDWKPTLPQVPS